MKKKERSFIKSMRIVLFVTVGISIIWNILCLLGVLPLESYTATYAFVWIPTTIINFRSLFFQTKDISTYIGDANQKEKVQVSILMCLIAAWAITIIACMVYIKSIQIVLIL